MRSSLLRFARFATRPLWMQTGRRSKTEANTSRSMLLLIDNYDSFTYNLAQYFGELGCDVGVRRNDEISLAQISALAPERICIAGGPCTPRKAGISKDVTVALGAKIPLRGICLR